MDVLLLDDLGKESPTSWSREVLFKVLNERYLADRRTLVTSNLDPGGLTAHLQDSAVWDRLRQRAQGYVIGLQGRSLRGGA